MHKAGIISTPQTTRRPRERRVKYLHKKWHVNGKRAASVRTLWIEMLSKWCRRAWWLVNKCIESQRTNGLVVRSLYQKYNEMSNYFLYFLFCSCKTSPLRKQTKSRVKKFLFNLIYLNAATAPVTRLKLNWYTCVGNAIGKWYRNSRIGK